MRHTKTLLRMFAIGATVGLAVIALPLSAQARVHVSVGIGVPVVVAPPPAVVYPAPVVVQQSPPVYTERQDVAPANEQGYWYYCAASRGYYPYAKECPGGWQKVPPTPQN